MITEGYLARHYRGRRGGRDPALLDIAQDHALKIIDEAGLFAMGLTFKGGTALRKYRVGSVGRFSTDLDFSEDEEGVADLLFESVDGTEFLGFRFTLEITSPSVRANLRVESPLGSPVIPSKIEVTAHRPWFAPETMDPVEFPVHSAYDFRPVSIPVMRFEENLAEKLAAFRRRGLQRDLYDLSLFHEGALDEELIRELTYLKVYVDVVEDGHGKGPFDASQDILRDRDAADFPPEDIGMLTEEVEPMVWLQ
ncbi:MAG: nucleotidyl transferase AbiEii/AbiGii toxin family protein, partial [Candidatus Methylomirabilales bacterium]